LFCLDDGLEAQPPLNVIVTLPTFRREVLEGENKCDDPDDDRGPPPSLPRLHEHSDTKVRLGIRLLDAQAPSAV